MYSKNHIYTLSLAHCNKDIIVNNEINIQKISIFSFNQYESKNVYNKNRLSENLYKKFDLLLNVFSHPFKTLNVTSFSLSPKRSFRELNYPPIAVEN